VVVKIVLQHNLPLTDLLPLNPNIILGCARAARMAGIEYAARLDQQ
jgi:hypothetical protein